MNRLSEDYQRKVDHKSWSTKALEEKIKKYSKSAVAARKLAESMENAKKASSLETAGEPF